ncbi:unnamed protein product [Caenorhabditis angaria]|uniref:SSD domain-containing protein n=1 Tax=Caenorhabditis angaria TaxID=860376 RepID=A0A9P1I7U7_9PELO|nr:unnamed protein product [Caenorhabditis angaria]
MGIVLNFKIVRGVDFLYAPLNATWKQEEAIFGENWAMDDSHFYPGKDIMRRKGIYLIINAKDGGNVLRTEYAQDFLNILNWIPNEKFQSQSGAEFTYKDVCLYFQNECFSNTHAKLIADIFSKNHSSTVFNITYPIYRTSYTTEPIDISKVLGNVSLNEMGYVNSSSAWMILYQLKNFSSYSKDFEQVLIIFAIMTTFTIKFVKRKDTSGYFPVIDWVLSKPLLGFCGVICTLFAIITSTGLLMLFDVTFVDMCTVMPFLSLTIGIDDTFLMLAAWHETDRSLSYQKRIETSMRHAAVSISITTLTDALAFLIGSFAPLPAVIYFCYYSSAAIVSIFFYCMTMFVAVLALQGKREELNQHSVLGCETIDINQYETCSKSEKHWKLGTHKISDFETNNNNNIKDENQESTRMWYQQFFEDNYAPFIANSKVAFFSLFLYFGYLSLSWNGVQNLKIGFDLINIVQEKSVSRKFLELRSSLFPEDTRVLDISVMISPNFSRIEERNDFIEVLNEFESTWCSEGRNSTQFWLFGMQKYLQELGFSENVDQVLNNPNKLERSKKTFLMSNEKYNFDVLSDNQFRLSTRLNNLKSDKDMADCAQTMRDLCAKHSKYEITTYSPIWNIGDEYNIMWPQTMQDVYISIAVMVPVALLFIPQPLCSIIIGLNISSIAFGVIGCMSYLNVSLDATSMITVAMSVGFSVDFAAHVSYAYMTEKRAPKTGQNAIISRFCHTLGTVGWPVTQASISVLLGVSSLYLVDSYVVQTCFRTVLLVIAFGTTHALLFLPLLLLTIHRFYSKLFLEK